MFLQACVSHSVQGVSLYVISCLAAWSNVPSAGVSVLVPCSFQGGLCPRGHPCLGEGGFCPGGSALPPPKNPKSKWYASYWNAFLLFNVPTGFQTSSNKEETTYAPTSIEEHVSDCSDPLVDFERVAAEHDPLCDDSIRTTAQYRSRCYQFVFTYKYTAIK